MSKIIKTPWGPMSLRQAAKKAGIIPQTLWYRYQQNYNQNQLFAPTVARAPGRLSDAELKTELKKRGYKVIAKETKKAQKRSKPLKKKSS